MNSTRRLLLKTAAIGVPLTLAGCASGPTVDPNDETRSLVYGYFDMDEGSDIGWVVLKRYDTPMWTRVGAEDGVFLHVGLQPGSWQVFSFGGARTVYEYGTQGRNETALRIERPGAWFMGSYRYVPVEKNWLSASTFDMKRTDKPDERTVLVKVLETMESEYAGYKLQIARARQRLAQFG